MAETPTAVAAPSGAETVETIFGSTTVTAKIPADAFEALKNTKKTYNLDGDVMKSKYVELLNNPKITAQGVNAYLAAARSLRGYFASGVFGPKSHAFVLQPFSVTTPIPRQDKNKGQVYDIRAPGIVLSKDPEAPLFGPVDFAIFGFSTFNDAQRRLDGAPGVVGLQPGKTYYIRGRIREGSPTGNLKPGEVTSISANPDDIIELAPATENGAPWNDTYSILEKDFPPFTISELYRKPDERRWYRFEMDVTGGIVSSKKDEATGQPRHFGILRGIDDSISNDEKMLKELQGGMGTFLPNHLIPMARSLSAGSRVSIVATCKLVDEKDPATKNPTGNKKPSWSVVAMKVLLDLGAGNGTTPEPGKVMVSLPTRAGDSGPSARDL